MSAAEPGVLMTAMNKDPYRFFRIEAAELLAGLTNGVQQLAAGPDPATVASLLRLAHTLKGACHVVRQPEIAEAAHSVEDILSRYREGGTRAPGEGADLLRLLDRIGSRLEALDAPHAPAPSPSGPPPAADLLDTVRVDVEDVQELMGRLSEAGAGLIAIQSESAGLARSRQLARLIMEHAAGMNGAVRLRTFSEELMAALGSLERRLDTAVQRTGRSLAEARERSERLRLLPAAVILPGLARAAREAAASLGKQVRVESAGDHIRLEAQVLTAVRDALLHLVRNAVAHGIESPEARVAAGKPACGRIQLRVERAAGKIRFVCRDDGSGIDLAAIRRAAVQRGLIPPGQADGLSIRQTIDLLLCGGVTTAAAATEMAGRGVGLDTVRDAVRRLKGDLSIQTETGAGTTVEILAPASLVTEMALLVEAGGQTVAIPLDAVREVVSVRPAGGVLSEDGRNMAYHEVAIPFASLAEVLGLSPADGNMPRTAVILARGDRLAAVGVERVRRTGTVVFRSLPVLAAAEPLIAGAGLDAEGAPLLALDPEALIGAIGSAGRAQPSSIRSAPAPILIVDDSLTTRMVEQGLLESAGYRTESAVSGEDALAKAGSSDYSLFLVDIEMPGMDGFEFIRRTRNDPRLRSTPAILVSSRNSPEDRRRGEQAGASAYVAKGEFDQAALLDRIRSLIGGHRGTGK